jgi:hypothetical protein
MPKRVLRKFVFGTDSEKQLATCTPGIQKVMRAALARGVMDFKIVEGHRGKTAQNIAYAKGNSQRPWPLGEHNALPSRAADIMPYPVDWSDKAANIQRCCVLAGIVLACAVELGIGIRWGGDWNMDGDTRDEKFRDYGHFEEVELA